MAKTKAVIMSSKDEDLSPSELKKKQAWLEKEREELAEAELAKAETETGKDLNSEHPDEPKDEEEEEDVAVEGESKEGVWLELESFEKNKVYVVDIALKHEDESMEDFIDRAERDKLGSLVDADTESVDPSAEATIGDGFIPGIKDVSKPKDKVKKIRVGIDNLIRLSSNYFPAVVEDSLFMAKGWLGELLTNYGDKDPYKNEDKIKNRSDIPATADTIDETDSMIEIRKMRLLNPEIQLVRVRFLIQEVISEVEDLKFSSEEVKDGRLAAIARTNAYANLVEAKIYLGRELSKLKI